STAAAPQLTGDLKQRTDQALARQNIDPLTATQAQRLVAQKEAADDLKKEQDNPWLRSTRTATPVEQFLFGRYGAAAGATDPRQMLGPGVLTPQQVDEGSAASRAQQADQQGRITRAREAVKLEYQGKRLLTPDEATRMQVSYGLTRDQAAELGRIPLTSQQANAVASTYAFERDAAEALALFEKVWPKQPQPELRRAALAELQRNQNEDFGKLQADLKSMPRRLAGIVQGSRPSDTERQVFEAALPTLASDNWSLVEVPSNYANGLGLIT